MMSVGIGIGVEYQDKGAGGGGGVTLLSAGSTISAIGDGIMSDAGTGGPASIFSNFVNRMNGRVQPGAVPLIADSGTTIFRVDGSNYPIINPDAIDCITGVAPDIAVFGSCGANDNLLSTDPGTLGSPTTMMGDWLTAVQLFYDQIRVLPTTKLMVIFMTWPSAKAGEATWRTTAHGIQRTKINALKASDSRVVLIDTSAVDPLTANIVDLGSYVHPCQIGGEVGGGLMYTALDPLIEAKTADEILAMILGLTYPGATAMIDTERMNTNTGGTLTNVGGALAGSKTVTNTTGASSVDVVCSMTAIGATGKYAANITLNGTASSDGNITFLDKVSFAATGSTRGQYVRTGWRVTIPGGFWNSGSGYGNYGATTNGNLAPANSKVLAAVVPGWDTVWFTYEKPVFAGAASAQRSLGFRFKTGAMPGGTLVVQQPFCYVPAFRTRSAVAYLGGVYKNTTAILGANYILRPTGAVTAAAGGTTSVETGYWAPEGMTDTDFKERRIYKNGTAGGFRCTTGIGTGTLMATLSGATWTKTWVGGDWTATDKIYVEIDVQVDGGTVVTRRSDTAITVT